jgi:hypothetical protein
MELPKRPVFHTEVMLVGGDTGDRCLLEGNTVDSDHSFRRTNRLNFNQFDCESRAIGVDLCAILLS